MTTPQLLLAVVLFTFASPGIAHAQPTGHIEDRGDAENTGQSPVGVNLSITDSMMGAELWLQINSKRRCLYRIDMPWGMSLLAETAAMMAALLTVSYQSIRTATANPVRALRAE